MNIVVALHSKTCFVIARPFFLSVLRPFDMTARDALSVFSLVFFFVFFALDVLDYEINEMPADREENHGTQSRLR